MKIVSIYFIIVLLMYSCAPSPRYTIEKIRKVPYPKTPEKTLKLGEEGEERVPVGTKFRGLASYYADYFHSKKTSNSETYDMYGLTCAHKTLPFHTWLEVTNLANGRTVIVRVNDRGPFIEGRIIDLSYGAAKELGMLDTGVEAVEIMIETFELVIYKKCLTLLK